MAINIYVTEKENKEDLSEIFRQIDELKEELAVYENSITELKSTIENLKKQMEDKPIEKIKKSTSKSIEGLYEPSEANKSNWDNLRLGDNTIEYINKRNAKCTIPLSIYELDLIREKDMNSISKKGYYKLCELLPVSPNTIAKAIYNIRENTELTHLLDLLHTKVKNCRFEVTKDGYLKIGKQITKIKKELAREWCLQCQNDGNVHEKIYDLHKAFPNIDKMQIKIVCENYDNSVLLDLLKEDKKIFIENNPSKRRNIIENNGGILK